MRVNPAILGLVLAAFAAPTLAGGSGNDFLMSGFGNDVVERPAAPPAALTAAPSADTQRRTFELTFTAQSAAPEGSAAARRTGRFGWKDQQASLQTPLDAPGAIAAAGPQPGARPSVPTVSEIVVTKSTDVATPKRYAEATPGRHVDLGDYMDDDLPAGLTGEATTKEGTFFGKVVRAGMELARREKERQQAALGQPVTFTAQVSPAPGKPDDQAVREHVSFVFEKIIWTPVPGSSKPKEIVVVGSKIDPPRAFALAPGKADGPHVLTSVQHTVRLPAPAVIAGAGPASPRGVGPVALPGNMDLGAGPALRR
jgi:type VI protein secretion system component Hcp